MQLISSYSLLKLISFTSNLVSIRIWWVFLPFSESYWKCSCKRPFSRQSKTIISKQNKEELCPLVTKNKQSWFAIIVQQVLISAKPKCSFEARLGGTPLWWWAFCSPLMVPVNIKLWYRSRSNVTRESVYLLDL